MIGIPNRLPAYSATEKALKVARAMHARSRSMTAHPTPAWEDLPMEQQRDILTMAEEAIEASDDYNDTHAEA